MKRPYVNSLLALVMFLLSLSAASAQIYWADDSRNPLMTDGPRLLEPCVHYNAETAQYDMWYCDGVNVKRAASIDGISWHSTGAWQNLTTLFSVNFCFSVEVVKIGSTYCLYAGCQTNSGVMNIGLATSPDGNVWTKHPSSPAITPGGAGSWEKSYALCPRIAYKDSVYFMYYQGAGSPAEIGLATSQDGVNWTKYSGNPVIKVSNVGESITDLAPAGVTVVDGTYYMILNEAPGATRVDGYWATSTDGSSWTLHGTDPVIPIGSAGTWNSGWLGGGSLRYLQGQFWYWYCATDTKPYQGDQTYRMGLATGSSTPPPEGFWHQTGGPLATQDIRYITSNSEGTIFAGTWTAGEVYKTTNDGDTWTVCGAIPNTNPVLGLTVDRHDHIFASVYLRGIARSTDDGATWQMKNNGLTSLTVRWSAMDRQENIWVATEGGLFRTTDDGENWTKMHTAMCYNVWMDSSGAIITQEGDGTGFDANGNSSNYVYRTTNGGTTWSTTHILGKSFAGIHTDGSFFANTSSLSRVFRSTDLGVTWTDLNLPVSWDGYTAQMAFLPQGDIFFTKNGDGAGVIRSTNGGLTWEVKNSGLTTLRVTCIYPHPDGYIFLGTGLAGVFRSTQPYAPPRSITVSLPNVATAAGNEVEIPVNVTSLSGWGVLSYEFTLTFNNPDSVLTFDATPITAGTLMALSGWSVQINTTAPNQVTVGAYGAAPLYGEGVLLKLKARTRQAAAVGDSSGLILTSFIFNTGTLEHATVNGSVTIHERICGDADENGSVQAYDAALTLREALGPMSPPPAPLTPMGRINADVNLDGKVQAFDAALILRHVVGLPMPESTATCFGTGDISGAPQKLDLTGVLNSKQYTGGKWTVQVRLAGVPANFPVISYAFELTTSAYSNDNIGLTLPQLGEGYLATVNPVGSGHFKVGIINPNGVDVESIPLTLSANYSSSLNAVTFSELFLNDAPSDTIRLANIFSSVEPRESVRPQSYDLIGAYPNPFNPSTRIVFETPASVQASVYIFTAQGSLVKVLCDEQMPSGRHEILWNGTNRLGQTVASGEYFCTMRAGSFTKTIRLLLLK